MPDTKFGYLGTFHIEGHIVWDVPGIIPGCPYKFTPVFAWYAYGLCDRISFSEVGSPVLIPYPDLQSFGCLLRMNHVELHQFFIKFDDFLPFFGAKCRTRFSQSVNTFTIRIEGLLQVSHKAGDLAQRSGMW
jgi:hypothetical protein